MEQDRPTVVASITMDDIRERLDRNIDVVLPETRGRTRDERSQMLDWSQRDIED
ncbi:hypothetical protein KW798_02240 [Candidatus Parcubacteria bacterium]|nr:hypothetical protein [Candidatus Parcubacteria bacterium]